MSGVRPLADNDLPQIQALHDKTWPHLAGQSDGLARYLRWLFIDSPFASSDFPSLVFEEDGRVVAVIGSLWRPMELRSEPLDMVVTHTFMADPDRKASLAPVALMKQVFSGEQRLTIAQGNEYSEKLWTRLGGEWSPILGLLWLRLLRPLGYVGVRLRQREQNGLGLVARSLASLMDPVLSRVERSPADRSMPEGVRLRETSADEVVDYLPLFRRERAIAPRYTASTLAWMLDAVSRRRSRGELRMRLVADADDDVIGWICYQQDPSLVFNVLTVESVPGQMSSVLRSLFADAYGQGAVGVEGPVDATAMREFSRHHCYFSGGPFLVHATDPEVLGAVRRGDCWLSRLESEWWLGFDPS